MSYGGPQNPGYGGYPQPGYGGQQGGYGGGYGGAPGRSYAGLGQRLVAVILDGLMVLVGQIPGWILYFVAFAMLIGSADARGQVSDAAGGVALLVMLLAYALLFIGGLGMWLYNVYLLGRDGATLGKRWMKIKVLDPAGQPLGFGKAFLRELVKGIIGNCFILLLWPLWDQEKQGLYDKLFSTHVYEA